MNSEKHIEKLVKELILTGSADADKRILDDALAVYEKSEKTKQSSASTQPNIWSIIMHSKITKPIAAAIIIVAVVLSLTVFNTTISNAYALEDTITACNSIHSIHVKESNGDWNSDIWIECDSYGQPWKFRYQTPNAGSIGALTVVNDGTNTFAWLPQYNLCYRTSSQAYYDSIIFLNWDISEVDPKLIFEDLLLRQESGEVILETAKPKLKNEPIVVTVTYPEGSQSSDRKKVLYIDQATKLLKKYELYYCPSEGPDQHIRTYEFSDYNQTIDPAIFTIDEELPDSILWMDQSDKEAGLAQDDMTDEEVADEITRQFFEAIIAKDYEKAGLLYSGAPGFLVEQQLMGAKVTKIVSVGPARPDPNPGSKAMISSCRALIESGGHTYELNMYSMIINLVSENPRRWAITGNSGNVNPASGNLTLTKGQVDTGAVIYNDLMPGEFMQEWLLLDPVPIKVRGDTLFPSDETQQIAFDEDLVNVSEFDPVVGIDGQDYQWSLLENDYGVIDLAKVDENWYRMTYAWAQIDMPEEKQAILGIGSDDGVKVWLNGELVHENRTTRGVEIDDDRVPVTFKKGMNQLVLKIQNGGGPWGFCCRRIEE